MNDTKDDYLWDRSGPADPEVARLEQLLAPYRWPSESRGFRLPAASPPAARRRAWSWRLAAAAAVLVACGMGWWQYRLAWPADAAWPVLSAAGEVAWAGRGAADRQAWSVGDELRTGADGEVSVAVARIGAVTLAPNSRMRLVETRTGRHRLQLVEGELRARVWAPPMQFGIDLPGVALWDLGCAFRIRTDATGTGMLMVDSGWTLLEDDRGEVLVPQGAAVPMQADRPLGTPRDQGASPAFVAALAAIDARETRPEPDDPAILALLAAARPEDAITFVALVQRHPHLAEGPVFDRLQAWFPGTNASREATSRGDLQALDAWWQALPYPRMKQWWWHWRDA